MTSPRKDFFHCTTTIVSLVLSAVVVALLFALQGHKDFNLWDEGFLWYGAQRVLVGEVPIRDFLAYDPARYYWAAAVMRIFGDNGIVSLRLANGLCQFVTLFLAVRLLARFHDKPEGYPRPWFLFASAVTLVAWMYVGYKIYDIAASIGLLSVFAYVLEKPGSRRHFLLGVTVGLVAMVGRNHGVYALVGYTGLLLWTGMAPGATARRWWEQALAMVAGIVVGFSPMLIAMLAVDGFSRAFLDSIAVLFEMKSTNLPLPVPWPWRPELMALRPAFALHALLVGFTFVALLVFPVLSIGLMVWRRTTGHTVEPVLVAATLLSVPYAHYAFSRADVPHLSFAIFPLLMGSLLLLRGLKPKIQGPLMLVLAAASVALMAPLHPLGKCTIVYQCVDVDVAGDVIAMPEKKAHEVKTLKALVSAHVPPDGSVLVTPVWPGAYALLGKRAPVYDIYALLKRSDAFQHAEIARLTQAKPSLAILLDEPLDGGNDQAFDKTNSLVNAYVLKHFSEVPVDAYPTMKAYKPK